MSSIQIEQNGHVRTIPLPSGETLLSALRRAGSSVPAACGRQGRRGTRRSPANGLAAHSCRVYPPAGETAPTP